MRKIIERPMKYKIGDKLGDLTVIDKIYGGNKGDKTKLLVKCKCGKEFEVSPYTLNTRKAFMCKECYIKSTIGLGIYHANRKPNDYKIEGNVVRNNDKILIDLEDLEKVKSYKNYWSINIGDYAYCKVKGVQIFLHRIILNLPIRYDENTGLIVDNLNGNRLDNRKCN